MNIFYWIVVLTIISSVMILFIVEILAKMNDIPNDNVNIIIRRWAFGKFYFITFFFGVISGHLFLGVSYRWFDCSTINLPFECEIFDVIVIALINILLLCMGLVYSKKASNKVFQVSLFISGIVAGHIIWSMNVVH